MNQTLADGEVCEYDATCLASEWWDKYADLVNDGIRYCIGDGTKFSYQGYMLPLDNGKHKIFGSDGIVHDVSGDTVIYIKFRDITTMEKRLATIKEAIAKEMSE